MTQAGKGHQVEAHIMMETLTGRCHQVGADLDEGADRQLPSDRGAYLEDAGRHGPPNRGAHLDGYADRQGPSDRGADLDDDADRQEIEAQILMMTLTG